jgi:NAD(P)H-quinone oxidoreductase subunit 5
MCVKNNSTPVKKCFTMRQDSCFQAALYNQQETNTVIQLISKHLFYMDRLAVFMMGFSSFLACIVYVFSKRFMQDDTISRHFLTNILKLLALSSVIFLANHLVVFLIAWFFFSRLMIKMMVHNPFWPAALAGGKQAQRTVNTVFFCLILGMCFLYGTTHCYSIHGIQGALYGITPHSSGAIFLTSLFLILSAIGQAGLWPFHRWVMDGLNTPTPVSALIHGFAISSGVFLLARFSPILEANPYSSDILFIFGTISVVLGCVLKMMQHDVKRMLACSTIEHMGFSVLLWGLGFGPLALGHLWCHGMVKVCAFLGSDSLGLEPRSQSINPSVASFCIAGLCGVFSCYLFIKFMPLFAMPLFGHSHRDLIVLTMVFMAGTDIALMVLGQNPLKRWPMALGVAGLMTLLWWLYQSVFQTILPVYPVMYPVLPLVYGIGFTLLTGLWVGTTYLRHKNNASWPHWILVFYVKLLNASQPNPDTITTQRTYL